MSKIKWNSESLTTEEKRFLKKARKEFKTFSAFSLSVGIERMALDGILKRGTATPENVQVIRNFIESQMQAA